MKIQLTLASLFYILMTSCSPEKGESENQLMILDIEGEYPTVSYQLSDFMTDPRVITLETNDSIPVGSMRALPYVGENIILTFDQQKIMLFDAEGNFIRQVANAGKGPGEFQYFSSYSVNEDETELYVPASTGILVYNLQQKGFEKIKLPFYLESFYLADNHFIVPKLSRDSIQLFYVDRISHEVVDNQFITPYEIVEGSTFNGLSSDKFISDGSFLFFQSGMVDTIYKYKNETFSPSFAVIPDYTVMQGKPSEGYTYSILTGFNNKLWVYANGFKYEVEENGSRIGNNGNRKVFELNTESSEIVEITEITNDLLDDSPLDAYRIQVNNGMVYVHYSPVDWLEKTVDMETDIDLPAVDLEDNPVFLVGRLK